MDFGPKETAADTAIWKNMVTVSLFPVKIRYWKNIDRKRSKTSDRLFYDISDNRINKAFPPYSIL